MEAEWRIYASANQPPLVQITACRCPAPSHDLGQSWNIVNWTIGNKSLWNRKRNSYIFTDENAFENVVWKMPAISSRPQCVKSYIVASHSNGLIWRFPIFYEMRQCHEYLILITPIYEITVYVIRKHGRCILPKNWAPDFHDSRP